MNEEQVALQLGISLQEVQKCKKQLIAKFRIDMIKEGNWDLAGKSDEEIEVLFQKFGEEVPNRSSLILRSRRKTNC